MTVLLTEQPGRKLYQIDDMAFWDKLPKELTGLPVYFRITKTGIELWPRYQQEPQIWPSIWVSP
jgi:hypothetical protein